MKWMLRVTAPSVARHHLRSRLLLARALGLAALPSAPVVSSGRVVVQRRRTVRHRVPQLRLGLDHRSYAHSSVRLAKLVGHHAIDQLRGQRVLDTSTSSTSRQILQ